jgi:hypothetical protein
MTHVTCNLSVLFPRNTVTRFPDLESVRNDNERDEMAADGRGFRMYQIRDPVLYIERRLSHWDRRVVIRFFFGIFYHLSSKVGVWIHLHCVSLATRNF